MDVSLAIEHDRDALTRIVVALVAMAGLGSSVYPQAQAEGEPRKTLPRRLYRAVLRLLRPAEAAARRLIIALSRGIAVTLPAPATQTTLVGAKRQTGQSAPSAATADPPAPRLPAFALLDPQHQPFARPWVTVAVLPRISVPGITDRLPVQLRENPSPHDPMDATRLARRLRALSHALEDLPRQALRFVRWQARRKRRPDRDRARLRWPLRLGRPPGWRRRGTHEVFGILDHANQLAHFVLEQPDTS